MTKITAYTDFNFCDQQVHIEVDAAGAPWFAAADAAKILGHSTPSRMVENAGLEDDEQGMSLTHGYKDQSLRVVNEAGLYKIILKSRKPKAKAFQNWVTREVLPTIRKTGNYANSPLLRSSFLLWIRQQTSH